jgi:hypothetical protein
MLSTPPWSSGTVSRRAEAESSSAEARRDAALRAAQVTLAQLTDNVKAFTSADNIYRDASVAAGRATSMSRSPSLPWSPYRMAA